MSILRKGSGKSHETSALIAGIAAFTTWGLIPVYWKLLSRVSALKSSRTVLSGRVCFSSGY